MIHFQISPPKLVKKPPASVNPESIRPAYLTLGTFAQTPKIHFERVQQGQSKKRLLIIRNPSETEVWLKFTKKPSNKFQLSCPVDNVIESNGQLDVEIVWTPTEEGSCFEAIQCQSSLSGIKLSIHLMGECTPAPKKPAAVRRRVLGKVPDPSPGPRSASLPRANDPALKLNSDADASSKQKMSMTLPRSPKLTFNRKSRVETASAGVAFENACQNSEIASAVSNSSKNDDTVMNLENIPPPADSNTGNLNPGVGQKSQSDPSIIASTPVSLKSALDKMDLFALPFTPETPRKCMPALRNATEGIPKKSVNDYGDQAQQKTQLENQTDARRETFVVDDETQFQQDSALSSRRDTYLVPRAQEKPELDACSKKLEFVSEQKQGDGDSGIDLTKSDTSPMLNETIVFSQAYDINFKAGSSSNNEAKVELSNKLDVSFLSEAVDMTLGHLNSEYDSARNPKPYYCQTEMISDTDSDSEDDDDRLIASALVELDDLELKVKGFLAGINVR